MLWIKLSYSSFILRDGGQQIVVQMVFEDQVLSLHFYVQRSKCAVVWSHLISHHAFGLF